MNKSSAVKRKILVVKLFNMQENSNMSDIFPERPIGHAIKINTSVQAMQLQLSQIRRVEMN